MARRPAPTGRSGGSSRSRPSTARSKSATSRSRAGGSGGASARGGTASTSRGKGRSGGAGARDARSRSGGSRRATGATRSTSASSRARRRGEDEELDDLPEKPKMDPLQLWGIIGGIVLAVLFLGYFFLPHGGGDNGRRGATSNNNDDDDGRLTNRPPIPPPLNNGGSSSGSGDRSSGGENLVALEKFANEVIRVAGVIHHSYQNVVAPEDGSGPSGNTMAITRTGPNQMARYIRDNRLNSFVEKDPSAYRMQAITPLIVKAYHELQVLVETAAEYSGNKVDTPESMAEVKAIHDRIIEWCTEAKRAIEVQREENRGN